MIRFTPAFAATSDRVFCSSKLAGVEFKARTRASWPVRELCRKAWLLKSPFRMLIEEFFAWGIVDVDSVRIRSVILNLAGDARSALRMAWPTFPPAYSSRQCYTNAQNTNKTEGGQVHTPTRVILL
jgi:hypothetical protein